MTTCDTSSVLQKVAKAVRRLQYRIGAKYVESIIRMYDIRWLKGYGYDVTMSIFFESQYPRTLMASLEAAVGSGAQATEIFTWTKFP